MVEMVKFLFDIVLLRFLLINGKLYDTSRVFA